MIVIMFCIWCNNFEKIIICNGLNYGCKEKYKLLSCYGYALS